MKHKKLKIALISTFALLPMVSLPLLSLFYITNKNETDKFYMDNLGTNSNTILPPTDASKDEALYIDSFNKATYDPDSILVYSIYWFGVFHRFGLISHVLSVLNINPNQKIYIMETSGKNDYSPLLATNINGTRIYPNVHIYEDNSDFDTSDDSWFLTNRYITPKKFFEMIEKENVNNNNIHVYFCDKILELVTQNYFNGSNLPILKKNLYDFWSFFNNYASFNIFSDGTHSVELFNKAFYEYFLKSNIGEYDPIDKEYKNAVKIRKGLKDNTLTLNEFLKNNNSIMYILSLWITKDFNKDNMYPKPKSDGTKEIYKDSQFFVPTTQFINDINENKGNPNSILQTNNGDFFNPYNSVEADLISLFRKIPDKINELAKILGIKVDVEVMKNELDQKMNNKYNIVYSGTLLENAHMSKEENETIQKGETEIIKAIYDLSKKTNHTKTIQVVYKGHPRDKTAGNIQKIFNSNFEKYYTAEEATQLKNSLLVIDPAIPYEFYLFSKIFDANTTNNKEVKLYSAYSTIVWFLFADNRINDLINIIINEKAAYNSDKIKSVYGTKSPIFNTNPLVGGNDKIITIEELKNKANS